MELIETNDSKKNLLQKSAQQRAALEDEVKILSERTEKMITNTLIIGGALVVSYFLVRQLSGSKKKKAKVKKMTLVREPKEGVELEPEESAAPSFMSEIGGAVASQITAFLLTLAKEKLMEFLASQAEKKKEEKE